MAELARARAIWRHWRRIGRRGEGESGLVTIEGALRYFRRMPLAKYFGMTGRGPPALNRSAGSPPVVSFVQTGASSGRDAGHLSESASGGRDSSRFAKRRHIPLIFQTHCSWRASAKHFVDLRMRACWRTTRCSRLAVVTPDAANRSAPLTHSKQRRARDFISVSVERVDTAAIQRLGLHGQRVRRAPEKRGCDRFVVLGAGRDGRKISGENARLKAPTAIFAFGLRQWRAKRGAFDPQNARPCAVDRAKPRNRRASARFGRSIRPLRRDGRRASPPNRETARLLRVVASVRMRDTIPSRQAIDIYHKI